MKNLYEINTQTYQDELIKNVSSCDETINAFIGRKAYDLIMNNLCKPDSVIYEFDTQIIDKSTILQLVDLHYLLFNKLFVKDFYLYWQKIFVSSSNEQSYDLKSFCILLINPNFASAWSRRKSIIINHSKGQTFIKRELEFNKLILMKHCKCEQAYVHRRWLVKNLDAINFSSQFFTSETTLVCQVLSKKVKANYYCWTYFNWLIEHAIQVCSIVMIEQDLRDTVNNLSTILYMNPSDFSIFHSRLNIIGLLDKHEKLEYFLEKETKQTRRRFLLNEFQLSDDLLIRYPEYTTVWNYRKYMYIFLKSSNFFDFLNNEILELVNELNESFLKNINSNYKTKNNVNSSDLVVSQLDNSSWLQVLIDRDFVISSLVSGDTEIESNNQTKFCYFLKKFILLENF